MKYSLLASTAVYAVLASAASAADFPSPATPYSWAGFYAGASAGGLWSHDTANAVSNYDFGSASQTTEKRDIFGVVGGVQAGYNYQVQPFVLGVEGELGWSSAKGGVSYAGYYSLGTQTQATHTASMPFFADLRGRIGYSFDRFLPYVTGGVVFADSKNNVVDSTVPMALGRSSSIGWAFGGGLEYALDSHWSVKAEYLMLQLPNFSRGISNGKAFTKIKETDQADVARLGLNFRF